MTIRHLLAAALLLVSALAQAQAQTQPRELPDRFWGDAWRGWHFYEAPEPELERLPPPPPKPSAATPKTNSRTSTVKAPELVEFERLQKTLEDVRNIAIMRPTELNNHRLKPVGLCCGLKVRIRVG